MTDAAPQRPSPPPPGGRLAGLDMLRGIAALCVLHFHVMVLFGTDLGARGKGYLAVDFFFMLSGYVMARTYEHRLAAGFTVARFMAARYRRLWPVMAIGTLIGAPMLIVELRDPARALAIVGANLLLLPAPAGLVMFPANSAAWSILAELSVNLLHGAVLQRWRARILAAAAGLAFAGLAVTAWTLGGLDYGAGFRMVWVDLLRAAFAYTVGVVLWRSWRDRPPFAINPWLAFAAMPVLLMLSQHLPSTIAWVWEIGFVAIACPLLIAGGLSLRRDSRWGHALGAISFPLYAVNLPLLHWSKGLGLGPTAGVTVALALASYIALRNAPMPWRSRALTVSA